MYRARLVNLPYMDGMIDGMNQWFRVCGTARANLTVLQTPEMARAEFLITKPDNLAALADLGLSENNNNNKQQTTI